MKVCNSGSIRLGALFPHKDVSSVSYYHVDKNGKGEVILRMYDENKTLITELPTRKRIACTKNLVTMTRQETQRCWSAAVKSLQRKYKKKETQLKEEHKEELDNKYREIVCKLPTDVLESILLCHEKGKFHRAKITLRAISDEIAGRALLNDSSRTK